jgi:hypothetical protein
MGRSYYDSDKSQGHYAGEAKEGKHVYPAISRRVYANSPLVHWGRLAVNERENNGRDYLWVLDEEATSLLAARCEAALSEIMSGQARCRPLG